MDPAGKDKWETLGRALLVAGVVAFAVLQLRLGAHPDDQYVVDVAKGATYAEAWTSPFLGRFYRPLIVTMVKVSLDLWGQVAFPLRLLDGLLLAANVFVFFGLSRGTASTPARVGGALALLASRCTFVGAAPFAVGGADAIVGLAFLLSVRFAWQRSELSPRASSYLVLASTVALASKESGLLVAAYAGLECARHRRWATCAILGMLVAAYLGMRSACVAGPPFAFHTGFLFDTYSIEELNARFADSRVGLYVYNVVASLTTLAFYFPDQGRFHVSPGIALHMGVFAFTTYLVARFLVVGRAWRAHGSLLAVIGLNACLGFNYVRPRIMFIGAFVVAMLLVLALDDLWRRPQRVLRLRSRTIVLVAFLVWAAMLAAALAHVARLETEIAAERAPTHFWVS